MQNKVAAPMTVMLTPPALDSAWCLVEEGAGWAHEHAIESIFAIGNGYTGTRGALVAPMSVSFPATFLAGVFDRRDDGSVPELLLGPEWARVEVRVEGRPLQLADDQGYRRLLDLRRGLLWHEWLHRDLTGRETRILQVQCASLDDRHLLLESLAITPQNYGGRLRLDAWLALPRRHPASRQGPFEAHALAPDPATVGCKAVPGEPLLLEYQTRDKRLTMTWAACAKLRRNGRELSGRPHGFSARVAQRWELPDVAQGETIQLDRRVVVYTSRDVADPMGQTREHLERTRLHSVADLREVHAAGWRRRWAAADISIAGDVWAERALRFAAYHLISAANPEDPRVSIGARALTGDAYKGHAFWDTETFMLPFYTFTYPEAAGSLLSYRYHTLDAARRRARELGYAGALYAWESADTGDEATPSSVIGPNGDRIRILTGEEEHHISADVAYAVWQYWQATGDAAFLCEAGAAILIETARFWASRFRAEPDGCFHIRRVIGPDEYHESIDDNAYTNLMGQWNLETAAAACDLISRSWPMQWEQLRQTLQLRDDEPAAWRTVAARAYTGLASDRGLYEQFAGYFGLSQVDPSKLAAHRTVPIDLVLGREAVQRSQVVKQPDVVMAVYLLWNRLAPAVREANFRYYEPRTAHGSSLSPAIHATVAARLGDMHLATRYFRQAAEIDLANNMGNAAGGVHMAALGGLWQAAVMGFAGIQADAAGLTIDPHLPQAWRTLSCRLAWRGRPLSIEIRQSPPQVVVSVESGDAVPVRLESAPPVSVAAGQPAVLPWDCSGIEAA